MGIEMHGFDGVQRKLQDLQRRAQELDGETRVSLGELFTEAFMSKCSTHSSFDALVDASPFTVESEADFAAIPDDEWDAHIQRSTQFSTWEEMKEAAVNEYVSKRLGL